MISLPTLTRAEQRTKNAPKVLTEYDFLTHSDIQNGWTNYEAPTS